MTTISTLAAPTQSNTTQTSSSNSSDLGQDEFLILMTTQLQNQDPLEPMDNDAFLGQLAQFSTVSGIDQMNETLAAMASDSGTSKLTDASSMLGRSVLVPGTKMRPDESGTLAGFANLSAPSGGVTITYTDPVTSEVLHVQDLGARPAGSLEFSWNEVPLELSAGRKEIRINVQAGADVEVDTYVYARVEGVTLGGTNAGDLIFEIEDYGMLGELEVAAIR
ncbi:MAG: flagellar biosynthesis protein FlgD [Rhodobacteraceae bacterium]|nr:flagellar biosynthesis protein FlgD [Paracoccaceae bacterium]